MNPSKRQLELMNSVSGTAWQGIEAMEKDDFDFGEILEQSRDDLDDFDMMLAKFEILNVRSSSDDTHN